MKTKKKWKVSFSEEAIKKFDNLPDDVTEELERIIKGFKTGKLDPARIGKPVDWVELKIKLRCPECKAEKVEWLLDKNSKEVTFHCLMCSESFWMTFEEYKDAVKKHSDCIVE